MALTIHKAQGSEADDVILLWPPQDERPTTSLLYTAMTRARRHLTIVRLAATVSGSQAQQRHPGDIGQQGSKT